MVDVNRLKMAHEDYVDKTKQLTEQLNRSLRLQYMDAFKGMYDYLTVRGFTVSLNTERPGIIQIVGRRPSDALTFYFTYNLKKSKKPEYRFRKGGLAVRGFSVLEEGLTLTENLQDPYKNIKDRYEWSYVTNTYQEINTVVQNATLRIECHRGMAAADENEIEHRYLTEHPYLIVRYKAINWPIAIDSKSIIPHLIPEGSLYMEGNSFAFKLNVDEREEFIAVIEPTISNLYIVHEHSQDKVLLRFEIDQFARDQLDSRIGEWIRSNRLDTDESETT